jgi:hypothetical protein
MADELQRLATAGAIKMRTTPRRTLIELATPVRMI